MIRLATTADAEAIARLSRDHVEHGLGWRYTPDRIRRAIRSPVTNVAVLAAVDALYGFGIMDYGDASAHLVLLAVHPECRGRGLGRHLLDWLETCARTAGLSQVRAEARVDNPAAIAFYRRQGYRLEARIGGYYGGLIDAQRLVKPLLAGDGI